MLLEVSELCSYFTETPRSSGLTCGQWWSGEPLRKGYGEHRQGWQHGHLNISVPATSSNTFHREILSPANVVPSCQKSNHFGRIQISFSFSLWPQQRFYPGREASGCVLDAHTDSWFLEGEVGGSEPTQEWQNPKQRWCANGLHIKLLWRSSRTI